VIVLSAIPDLGGVAKEAAADALLAVGNVLHGSGDLSGAQTNWSKVMLRYVGSPAWPEAVFNLEILCKEKKQYMEAIAFFNTLLESKSTDMAAYRGYSHSSALELPQCYEALNNYTNALNGHVRRRQDTRPNLRAERVRRKKNNGLSRESENWRRNSPSKVLQRTGLCPAAELSR
jgi:hypothetical protein